MGSWGKTIALTLSKLFLKILTELAIMTETGSLFYHSTTLTEKAYPLLRQWLLLGVLLVHTCLAAFDSILHLLDPFFLTSSSSILHHLHPFFLMTFDSILHLLDPSCLKHVNAILHVLDLSCLAPVEFILHLLDPFCLTPFESILHRLDPFCLTPFDSILYLRRRLSTSYLYLPLVS